MSNDNKELIEKLEKELEPSKNQINTEILEKAVKEEQIKLKGLTDFYNLRNTWSWIIGISISFLLTSQIVIVFLIGCNVLIYNSTVVISIFFAETFAQIIGLAILVVKFLFKEN